MSLKKTEPDKQSVSKWWSRIELLQVDRIFVKIWRNCALWYVFKLGSIGRSKWFWKPVSGPKVRQNNKSRLLIALHLSSSTVYHYSYDFRRHEFVYDIFVPLEDHIRGQKTTLHTPISTFVNIFAKIRQILHSLNKHCVLSSKQRLWLLYSYTHKW